MWGETVTYTLDGTVTGGSNGYATESSITQNDVTWSVVGNTTESPWRIGGKSLTNTDRTIASTTTIASNISKVVVTHGTASSVTVNSLKLIVASDANFSTVVSTVTGTFTASNTTTFTCPNSANWTDRYYKIVYNITISSTSNKYLQFKSAEFYGEASTPATRHTVTFNAGSGTSTASLIETSAGAGVTLPISTIDCGEWSFAGWAEAAVGTETTNAPTLLTAESTYKPTENCTLYAVYQRTETTSGGGGGESHSITITPNTFTDKGSNNYGSGTERIGSENAVSFGGHYITGNVKNTPSGAIAGTYLQCQANNATIYNKTELPGKITKIVVNQHEARAFSLYCGKEQLVASNNTNTGVTPSGTKITDTSSATTMTWNVSGDYTFFALKKGSNAGYITSIVITYQTDGGQSETTYYHSTPECTTETSRYLTPKHRGDSGGT